MFIVILQIWPTVVGRVCRIVKLGCQGDETGSKLNGWEVHGGGKKARAGSGTPVFAGTGRLEAEKNG